MVFRIVKNQTQNPVQLEDLGVTVPVNGQIDLAAGHTLELLSMSGSLAVNLGNGNLTFNVGGDADIPYPESVDIIRNIPQVYKTTADNKLVVNATPQPGTMTDFSLTSITDGGDSSSTLLHIDHTIFVYGQDTQGIDKSCGLYMDNGGTNELSKYWLNTRYLDFNVLGNRSFFYDGGLMWRGLSSNGANGMMALNLAAVSSVFDPTDYEVVPGTGNAALVDGYLLVPMPGLTGGSYSMPIGQNETVTPQNLKITGTAPMVMSGTFYAPAFWQLDYNLTTKKFFNLLPVEDPYAQTRELGTGDSNIVRVYGNFFLTEIPLMGFMKDFLVIGDSSNFFSIASPDATEIPHGVRMRMDCKTVVSSPHTNATWTMVGYVKTYREHTV